MATNERSEFLKNFESHKKAAASAAKVESSGGFLSNEEIANSLDLSENTKKVFEAKLSKVRYGNDKNNDPYFSFDYVLRSGKKGMQIGEFFGLAPGKTKQEKERYSKRMERLFGNFQRFGIDTTKWTDAQVIKGLVDSADKLTEEKPCLQLGLGKYVDPKTKAVFVNFNVVSVSDDPGDDDDDDAPEDNEVDTGDTQEAPIDDSGADESWVGYTGTITIDDVDYPGTATAWNAEAGTFDFTTTDEDVYEVYPSDITWDE